MAVLVLSAARTAKGTLDVVRHRLLAFGRSYFADRWCINLGGLGLLRTGTGALAPSVLEAKGNACHHDENGYGDDRRLALSHGMIAPVSINADLDSTIPTYRSFSGTYGKFFCPS
ncbi:hypothetical protein EON82_17170 [bacterium]|nr:MAG: hypothetical protein EON82_17170 [bacterium]